MRAVIADTGRMSDASGSLNQEGLYRSLPWNFAEISAKLSPVTEMRSRRYFAQHDFSLTYRSLTGTSLLLPRGPVILEETPAGTGS